MAMKTTHKYQYFIDGLYRDVSFIGTDPCSISHKNTFFYKTYYNENDDADTIMKNICTYVNVYSIFSFQNVGCIILKDNVKLHNFGIEILQQKHGFKFSSVLRKMIFYQLKNFKNNSTYPVVPHKQVFSADITCDPYYRVLSYTGSNPFNLGLNEWKNAYLFNNYDKEGSVDQYWQNLKHANIKSIFYMNDVSYICILSKDIVFTVQNESVKYIHLENISVHGIIGKMIEHERCLVTSSKPIIKKIEPDPPQMDVDEKIDTYTLAQIQEIDKNCASTYTMTHTHKIGKEFGTYTVKQIHKTNKEIDTYTSVQIQQIEKKCAEQEFNETVNKIMMGTKKIKKYVDLNPNELCPFVIIFLNDKDETTGFIRLFKMGSDVKIIDKIYLIGESMLVFLKSEQDFDEFKSIISSWTQYEMYGEMDFMYPGFFDEKYNEIQSIVQKIRVEKMNEYNENLKRAADESVVRKNTELQTLLARKELEKLMRKLDLNIAGVEHLYDLLKIKMPTIRNIMHTYYNKSVQDIENLIYRITSFLLKQYICDGRKIIYHPLIYCASVILLLSDNIMYDDAQLLLLASVGTKITNGLKIIRQNEYTNSNGIHEFLSLDKKININFNMNELTYYGQNMNLREFEILKKDINEFIVKDMLCFKEIILNNFTIIISSKIHASGLFEELPKDIMVIIIQNMITLLKN